MASPFIKQLFACFATLNLYLINGYVLGMISLFKKSPLNDQISNNLTTNQESYLWIAFFVSVLVSQCCCGFLTDIIGRKDLLLPSCIPGLLAHYLLLNVKYSAEYYHSLLAAYAIAGLMGGALSIGSTMVAEICSPKYRGAVLGLILFLQILGTTTAHYLNNLCALYFGILFFCLSFVGLVSTVVTPESPVWLACKMRFEECTAAFHWLKGDGDAKEVSKLIRSQEKSFTNKQICNYYEEQMGYEKRNVLKAFIISLNLVICMEISCNLVVNTVNDVQNIYKSALLFDVTILVSVATGGLVLTKVKRRYLLFVLGVTASCLLFAMVTVLFIFSVNIPDEYTTLMKSLFYVYIPLVYFGIVPVTFILLNEIYPPAYRGTGIVLIGCVQGAIRSILTLAGPNIFNSYSSRGILLVSSILFVLSLLYLYKTLPETFNKTLTRIEYKLNRNGNKKSVSHFIFNIDVKEKMLQSLYPPSPDTLMKHTQ